MGLLSKPLPSDHDDAAEWAGTDDDVWYLRWRLHVKNWYAFGWKPTAARLDLTFVYFPFLWFFPFTVWFTGWSWWYLLPLAVLPVARTWRVLPIVILAAKGRGPWRIESSETFADAPMEIPESRVLFFPKIQSSATSVMSPFFLSRVQYWTRWHVAIHWPLLITAHFYWKAEDVMKLNERDVDTDGKLWNFYRGWHRDELAYWGDGAFLGRVQK